ncbi:MAG: hypothetical protein PHQ75_00805 [Thermoguttaceae bacterium]|nr:hypothetical protein [Thermoguttaceae bacterium]
MTWHFGPIAIFCGSGTVINWKHTLPVLIYGTKPEYFTGLFLVKQPTCDG